MTLTLANPPRRDQLAAEAIDALSATGWLAGCPADFRAAMLRLGRFRLAAPGESFYEAGEEDRGMFALARGTAEVALDWGHPDTPLLHLVQAGFWAGYRPLLGRPTMLHLRARTEVLVALFPRRAVAELLAANPEWWFHIAVLVEANCEIVARMMADLTLRDSRLRAIATLLRLADCRFHGPPPGANAEVLIGQYELAAAAVLSRNTMSAILAELTRDGLVAASYKRLRILHPADLRAILDAG